MLAVGGAIISVYGTYLNNINHDHEGAMIVWMYSNVVLFLWAVGNAFGYWDGGLGAIALVLMYMVYAVTNLYGLLSLPPKRGGYT